MWTFKIAKDLSMYKRWQLETLSLYIHRLLIQSYKRHATNHYQNLLRNINNHICTKQQEESFEDIAFHCHNKISTTRNLKDYHDNICAVIDKLNIIQNNFLYTIKVPNSEQIVYESDLLKCETAAWSRVKESKYNVNNISCFYLWQFLLRYKLPFCYVF
jgi:hypothetical protein